MDRYSFGTYLLDEHNQEAFQLCHDIANLSSEHKQPILLVGDTGSGKTHLLYSIIGRIRTSTARTGIAYVTATEFPFEVRNLIAHPKPVEEAPHAVLLVDQLESFDTNLEVLENVIRLFLNNGHSVVCATNVHPSRLSHLPGGLSKLLHNGHEVSILPQDSPTRIELIESTIREEHEQVMLRLEEDVAELRNFVTSTSESHSTGDIDDETLLLSLRKELEVTQAELELARTHLELPGSSTSRIESTIPSTQYANSLKALQDELEQLRAENALNTIAVKESSALRDQIKHLEGEHTKLREQLEQRHTARLQNTDEPLIDHEARDEARALVERAETLVEVMRRNRNEFSESQELHTKQMEEIQELETIFKRYETSDIQPARSELVSQWESALMNAETERDDLAERLRSRQEEQDALQQELVDLKKVFEDAQRQLAEKTEAIVALDLALEKREKDATEALSTQNEQVASYESRIVQLEDAARVLKQNEAFVQGELLKLQAQLGEAGGFVEHLLDACIGEDEEIVPDSGIDTTLLDTLEGAQLLERMELEELDVSGDSRHDEGIQDDTTVVLHHVKDLKENLDALTEGHSDSGLDDAPESKLG